MDHVVTDHKKNRVEGFAPSLAVIEGSGPQHDLEGSMDELRTRG